MTHSFGEGSVDCNTTYLLLLFYMLFIGNRFKLMITKNKNKIIEVAAEVSCFRALCDPLPLSPAVHAHVPSLAGLPCLDCPRTVHLYPISFLGFFFCKFTAPHSLDNIVLVPSLPHSHHAICIQGENRLLPHNTITHTHTHVQTYIYI